MRPALEVGVHLNLTDGRPVLPARRVPTLVNAAGAFRGGRHYSVAARILSGRMARHEIRAEWEAQIGAVKDAGLDIRHLNAHGHLHLIPRLHEIVVDLLEQFAIPHVRVVMSGASIRGAVLGVWSRGMVRSIRARRLPVTFPDRIIGLGQEGALTERWLLDTLSPMARTTRAGTTELIVHPALGVNEYHAHWHYAGEEEANALLSERVGMLVRGEARS